MQLNFAQPFVQNIQSLSQNNISMDVLRLDAVHPVISGNKWFKLQYYLQDAIANNFDAILTFGGAFSNHIIATAAACKLHNLRSIGIIRGERGNKLSHTLSYAKNLGMELNFVSRDDYKSKKITNTDYKSFYLINEGGFGYLGAKGAATILQAVNTSQYTHILCACGTGTMLAGLAMALHPNQKLIGINVLKGYENLLKDAQNIVPADVNFSNVTVLHQFHCGGYAKHNNALIELMNNLWLQEKLPTDFVYTAKLFYAVEALLQQNYFEPDDRLLLIHSGGLQGNQSIKDKLFFSQLQ